MRLRVADMPAPVLRVLLRRSKDEGQEFSLDVQRDGAVRFAEALLRRSPPVQWVSQREYVDDGIAGDDFLGRAGLRRLLDELRAGDLVVCRDHSRLGRDALEVTIAVREIVRHRGARLFYHASGQEVAFNSAIDAATTFIQGVGAQMELEAIRSRTRESLRLRVKQGYVAGGRCYGYENVRQPDASGRLVTIAVIKESEAAIVREIFRLFIEGAGLHRIAVTLNNRGVPSPQAGRRGTGSWAPSMVREILRRERYRGVYVHGRIDRVRKGGKRVAVAAPADQVIRREVAEWRIIDEDTWETAQKLMAERAKTANPTGRTGGPQPRHMLTGLARCGVCGGALSVANTRGPDGHVPAYTCGYHHKRGAAVCPVTIYQPISEIDEPLALWVRDVLLAPPDVERLIADMHAALKAERPAGAADVARLERELEKLRADQRKYAAAVANAPDVPELLAELRRRGDRIRQVEGELAALRRPPVRAAIDRIAQETRARLERWHEVLTADRERAREVFQSAVPGGFTFTPHALPPEEQRPTGRGRPRKQVWAVSLTAHTAGVVSPTFVTPPGIEPGIAT